MCERGEETNVSSVFEDWLALNTCGFVFVAWFFKLSLLIFLSPILFFLYLKITKIITIVKIIETIIITIVKPTVSDISGSLDNGISEEDGADVMFNFKFVNS